MTDWTGSITQGSTTLNIGHGTNYPIAGLSGWKDQISAPLAGAVSLGGGSNTARERDNGSFEFPYWMADRDTTIQLEVIGTPSMSFTAAVQALEAVTQPRGNGSQSLTLALDGLSTTVTGAVTSRIEITDLAYMVGYAVVTVIFEAWDPKRYAPSVSGTTGLPATSGGLTFPITFPITFNTTITSGQLNLVNTGNANGSLTVTIAGPCTGPVIIDTQTGATLAFSSSFTISSGDTLVIDPVRRSVLYNGQQSRSAFITQRGWPSFQPGVNTYTFNAATYNAMASMTIVAQPAYL